MYLRPQQFRVRIWSSGGRYEMGDMEEVVAADVDVEAIGVVLGSEVGEEVWERRWSSSIRFSRNVEVLVSAWIKSVLGIV